MIGGRRGEKEASTQTSENLVLGLTDYPPLLRGRAGPPYPTSGLPSSDDTALPGEGGAAFIALKEGGGAAAFSKAASFLPLLRGALRHSGPLVTSSEPDMPKSGRVGGGEGR